MNDFDERIKKLETENGISDADRLVFLSNYLLRARQDSMQDKAVLTQITYLKVIVFATLFSLLSKPSAAIGLAILPIVLFSLDFLHRSRFNEIFDRWHFSDDKLIPRIKELTGETFDFLETIISSRSKNGEYARSEGAAHTIMTALGTIGTIPVSGAYLVNVMSLCNQQGAYITAGWCGLLFAIYILLFVVNEKYRSTHISPFLMPSIITISAILILIWGESIIGWYSEALALAAS